MTTFSGQKYLRGKAENVVVLLVSFQFISLISGKYLKDTRFAHQSKKKANSENLCNRYLMFFSFNY